MQNKHSACTAILIGKKASMDGSTIIARNEDGYGPIGPKKFVVYPAVANQKATFISKTTGVHVSLPQAAYRYTATPSADDSEGVYAEAGINQFNVGMSATETTFTNPRVLGYDPLVHDGVDEEAMLTLVLPYIKTAREGVQRLGALIEKYGTGESNGIAFNDHDEVWYLETAGGHHWAAQRIPDDAYAIAPNQINIQEIDLADSANYLATTDLAQFVSDNQLNPRPNSFNFREIFGTHDEADAYYNTPRAWYGQKLFSPAVEQEPTSQTIPFIQHADRQLAVEDVEFFLSSHYNGTKFDPFGTFASGTPAEQKRFRSIAMDRNQISCILQIRNNVPAAAAAIQWIALGQFAYNPYVPFYTNITDTPTNYRNTTDEVSLDNAYWLAKTMAALIEPHFHEFAEAINAYRNQAQSDGRAAVIASDQAVKQHENDLPAFLTQQNAVIAGKITDATKQLFDELVKHALTLSQFVWEKGQNL